MTTIDTATTTLELPTDDFVVDDAQLATAAFLARYSGRTLGAYRHDLRGFFQWAADHDLPVLAATRPHIELYRSWMEERGLAESTIDRRLSTVCGFYRFAHIDGRIASNPAAAPELRPPRRLRRRGVRGWWLKGSAQPEHRHQRVVDTPQLFATEMACQLAQTLHIDGADLFDQNARCFARRFDLRAERRGSGTAGCRCDEHDRAGQEFVGLNDNTEAVPALLVADALGELEPVQVTSEHAETPSDPRSRASPRDRRCLPPRPRPRLRAQTSDASVALSR